MSQPTCKPGRCPARPRGQTAAPGPDRARRLGPGIRESSREQGSELGISLQRICGRWRRIPRRAQRVPRPPGVKSQVRSLLPDAGGEGFSSAPGKPGPRASAAGSPGRPAPRGALRFRERMVGSAPFQGHDKGRAGAEPRPPGAGSLPPPFFADRSATRYCPPRPPDGPLGALKTRPAAAVAAGGTETGETEPRARAPMAGQAAQWRVSALAFSPAIPAPRSAPRPLSHPLHHFPSPCGPLLGRSPALPPAPSGVRGWSLRPAPRS